MTDSYLPLVMMAILALLFAGLSFAASTLLAPRRPTSAKLAAYESGIVPEYEPSQRFPVKFYQVGMIFILLDIEIVLFYPWAVVFRDLGVFGLVAMGIFLVPFIVVYALELSSGGLDWGPPRRLAGGVSEPAPRPSEIPRPAEVLRVPRRSDPVPPAGSDAAPAGERGG